MGWNGSISQTSLPHIDPTDEQGCFLTHSSPSPTLSSHTPDHACTRPAPSRHWAGRAAEHRIVVLGLVIGGLGRGRTFFFSYLKLRETLDMHFRDVVLSRLRSLGN